MTSFYVNQITLLSHMAAFLDLCVESGVILMQQILQSNTNITGLDIKICRDIDQLGDTFNPLLIAARVRSS